MENVGTYMNINVFVVDDDFVLVFCEQPVLPDVSPESLVAPDAKDVSQAEEEADGGQGAGPGFQPPI